MGSKIQAHANKKGIMWIDKSQTWRHLRHISLHGTHDTTLLTIISIFFFNKVSYPAGLSHTQRKRTPVGMGKEHDGRICNTWLSVNCLTEKKGGAKTAPPPWSRFGKWWHQSTLYQIITQNLDTCTWHTLHEPFMSFYTTSIQGLNIATHIPAPIMKQALSEMAWGFAIKEIESEHENTVNKFYSHGVWEYIMKMSCQFTCEFWNIQQRLTTLKSSWKRQTETWKDA